MSVKLRRLWIQMTSDRKRFGVLCVTIMLGLLLWARIIVVSRMPRMAIANESATTQPDPKAAPGSGGARARGATVIDLAAAPARDPFVISPTYFPKPTGGPQLTQEAQKSGDEPAEDPHQAEQLRTAALKAAAEQLRLEAAMGVSMAVISGKAYRRGDWIVANPATRGEPIRFQLAEVRQRSVILETEGRRFELKISTPGRE
jgi:hypothetical protein